MTANHRSTIQFFFIVIIGAISLRATPNATFYLLGDPTAVSLIDQYEQPLSETQKKAVPPYAPFELIKTKIFMGDQITQAMQLSYFGTPYFIRLDERGIPAELSHDKLVRKYPGCIPKYDTLIVNQSSVAIYHSFPPKGKSFRIKKGETVIRVFTYRGASFLMYPNDKPAFGWTYLSKGSLRSPITSRGKAADGFSPLHTRIMHRLQSADERYKILITYFNGITGQQKSIPHWSFSVEGDKHFYTLEGSPETVNQLASSTESIVSDIERILLGKPYSVYHEQGNITIKPR